MLPALLVPLALAAFPAQPRSSAAAPAPAVATRPAARAGSEDRAAPVGSLVLEGTGDRARRLVAELLIDAESVDLTAADPEGLRFVLERQGAAYRLDVGLAPGTGRIERVALHRAPARALGDGELSWLGIAIGDRERVVAAAVGGDGVVVIELDDGVALPLTQAAGDDYVGC
jgi:hypothetical protein